ncbi:MAG: proline dehydrogenase family protein [Candidatus Eremiobacteraeota bacterium]|nr:proline dehydrogenase family protein [Candidatus Eremiobacteraeota bacterium]
MLRAALLGAANNESMARFVMAHGRRFGAYRFVAGETFEQFMRAVAATNAAGMRVAAGLLGEDVSTVADARAVAAQYCGMLERFAAQRADANVALKLTHLGLLIDSDLARENVAKVIAAAGRHGNFVRMDMEQSACVQPTLDIYRALRADGLDNIGIVLQSYLYRSRSDFDALLHLRPSIRIVKGAYLEPASVAYPRKRDVDRNYVALMEASLSSGGFTAIATHDEAIVQHAIEFIQRNDIAADRFEFQMLYGVRPRLQQWLVARGFGVRIAVPFGAQWYPYFMRRLAERPANLMFFLSSMWRA